MAFVTVQHCRAQVSVTAVPIVLPKCGVPRISSNNIADFTPHSPSLKVRQTGNVIRKHFLLNCMNIMANDDNGTDDASYNDLKAGSPIVIIEPPPYLKTAEPMPMMRPNGGSVMPGDAGRIIGRKPKDVWAIRLASGAFLIDRKYFKPLELK